jgi:hypothetical protein
MGKRTLEAQAGMVRYSTFLRRDQLEQMRTVQEAQGIPMAEQIRRAIDAALGLKTPRKGGRT